MLNLVYLACVYKNQGGSLKSLVLSAFGGDVGQDKDPPTTKADQDGNQAIVGGTGDTMDGDAVVRSSEAVPAGADISKVDSQPNDEETGVTKFRSLLGNNERFQKKFGISSQPTDSDDTSTAEAKSARPVATGVLNVAKTIKQQRSLPKEERQALRRKTIKAKFTPLVVLSSFVYDLDHISNWWFLRFVLAGHDHYIRRAALAIAIVGSVMWVLVTTDFTLLGKVRDWWTSNTTGRLENVGRGWQVLASILLEYLPQFIITMITKPSSGEGVFKLSTTALSLVSKIINSVSSNPAPSLSNQYKLIDEDPAVSRLLLKLRDQAKEKVAKVEQLAHLTWINRSSTDETKDVNVFEMLQVDSTFVDGDLESMKEDLFRGSRLNLTTCSLTGTIPSQLGAITTLQVVNLSGNKLSGVIPAELGQLSCLEQLNLSDNHLSGSIPADLAALGQLLSLVLAKNNLTGKIPTELGTLPVLQELDLSHNMLKGSVPKELGNLASLRSLSLGYNILSGAQETETILKPRLHPECETGFLPQSEQKTD